MTTSKSVSQIVKDWLVSCERNGKISRNTVAVGIVVLDRLQQKSPVTKSDLFSKGGELKGSRSGLSSLLSTYGIPEKYLKEVTTRQAHQDAQILLAALEFGKRLAKMSPQDKEKEIANAVSILTDEAKRWLSRQPIRINCDREASPASWITMILEKAKGRSGGVVEQHLVGAKLQTRHRSTVIPNLPSHAGDMQTRRSGDFSLGTVSYHVTATDGKEAVDRCKENVESGTHPVLLVPRRSLEKARWRTADAGIQDRVLVLSIEDFLSQNVVEMSTEYQKDFFSTLEEIIGIYNTRLEAVETDMSLKIELH